MIFRVMLDVYRLWRPSPLFRARRLEKLLDTPAKIFYKYEGVSPAGSHKPNTAVPQVWYNAKEGVRKLTTETGAGQWGSSLAFACAQFGLECEIWQVAALPAKPHRRTMMETWGGKVHPSPSEVTEFGRKFWRKIRITPGSLGIAISEAVSEAIEDETFAMRSGACSIMCCCTRQLLARKPCCNLPKWMKPPMYWWVVPAEGLILAGLPSHFCVKNSPVT